jgi:hypothetical protein
MVWAEGWKWRTVMGFRPGSRIGDSRKRRIVGFTGSMRVSFTLWSVCNLFNWKSWKEKEGRLTSSRGSAAVRSR